jgi:hypothetical protein
LRLSVLLVAVIFVGLRSSSCKREPASQQRGPVSVDDIKIGYPPVAEQERRMGKFWALLEGSTRLADADETLRRMVEQVPLEYVASQLEAVGQRGSVLSKPNIGLLLGRINEVRNLHQTGASGYVDKLTQDRNVNGLCVSLCGFRTESMQVKAADALASLRDPNAVRVLSIRMFGAAAMPVGGSEAQVTREEFRCSLARALASCTGLDFSKYDESSETATLEVVKECQDWLEKTGR